MRVYIANQSKQKYGGGWTFIRNLVNGLSGKVEFIDDFSRADIIFIASSSMVDKTIIEEAKKMSKRIILRVDNIPRNSRNRNTGTSRLKKYAELADRVIYQSEWAQWYVGHFIKREGQVIYNGVDTKIFKKDGFAHPKLKDEAYLFSQYNRDENKRYNEALYYFYMRYRENPNCELWMAGRYSPDVIKYNFDMFMDEPIEYLGVGEDLEVLAGWYRGADYLLAPYYNDACSNTILEARACGCKILTLLSGDTGGTPEILQLEDISAKRMCEEYLILFKDLTL